MSKSSLTKFEHTQRQTQTMLLFMYPKKKTMLLFTVWIVWS